MLHVVLIHNLDEAPLAKWVVENLNDVLGFMDMDVAVGIATSVGRIENENSEFQRQYSVDHFITNPTTESDHTLVCCIGLDFVEMVPFSTDHLSPQSFYVGDVMKYRLGMRFEDLRTMTYLDWDHEINCLPMLVNGAGILTTPKRVLH